MNRYTHLQEIRVMAAVEELAGMLAAKIEKLLKKVKGFKVEKIKALRHF